MPLIVIHSLPPPDPNMIPSMLVEIRDAGAAALGCSPSNIWVMFCAVPPGCYVQGLEQADAPRPTSHPPCVIVRAQVGRQPEERTAFVAAIAATVGETLGVPADNVWIHYQEMRSEDVWFGSRWAK
jgi:phenylpyruvate tautomerase PptA (4-oxalocrotonate tautomerase family)